MAKLILADHGELTLEDLHAALSQRLSNRYKVDMRTGPSMPSVTVGKTAWMGIEVGVRRRQNQYTFITAYRPTSDYYMRLSILLFPLFLFVFRSRSRHELEAEVIEAIRDSWPEVTG